MSTATDLSDAVYAVALDRARLGGGIGEVERDGSAVMLYGSQPGLLRPLLQERTCVRALASDFGVRATVLGGRSGIPQGVEIFSLDLAAMDVQEFAGEVVRRISQYLATTTS